MQFITIALLAAASLTNAQSVPGNAPGCVKYCLRIAREQTPSACNWAGWCATIGFQDAVSNCYSNICGPANRQVGAQIYQQICASAGSDTSCPSGGATASATAPVSSAISSISESASSAISSVASEASSAVSSASDVVTTIAGVATTIPASATSSVAAELSSSAAGASSSSESVASSVTSALSTATAPVSSAISSILSSAASVVSSVTAGGAAATESPNASNAASAIGLPSSGEIASLGAMFIGIAAGALML